VFVLSPILLFFYTRLYTVLYDLYVTALSVETFYLAATGQNSGFKVTEYLPLNRNERSTYFTGPWRARDDSKWILRRKNEGAAWAFAGLEGNCIPEVVISSSFQCSKRNSNSLHRSSR